MCMRACKMYGRYGTHLSSHSLTLFPHVHTHHPDKEQEKHVGTGSRVEGKRKKKGRHKVAKEKRKRNTGFSTLDLPPGHSRTSLQKPGTGWSVLVGHGIRWWRWGCFFSGELILIY
ncbi:hypothetical protein ABW19_dt0200496 [Dactylella cylindrospora]|nr:hypothetical protein ABW19_dt0200496 [Dactylella cylindrospora]